MPSIICRRVMLPRIMPVPRDMSAGTRRFGMSEVGEQLFEREMAQVVEFVFLHLADAIVRRDLVEDAARLAERVGNGAVEIENQRVMDHPPDS